MRSPPGSSADWATAPAMAIPVLPVRSALPGMTPGIDRAGGVEAGLDRLAGGHRSVAGCERGKRRLPAGHAVPPLGGLPLGLVAVPAVEPVVPLGPHRLAPGDAPAVQVEHLVGHPEGLVGGEAEQLLGQSDLVGGERVAVGLGRVHEVGRRVADVAAEDDQRGPVLLVLGPQQRRLPGRRRRWPPRRCCRPTIRRRRSARPRRRCRTARWGRRW